jgi:hypothetical protein
MRTTVDIPDDKYRLLKAKAASEGATVKQLVMKGVDTVLGERGGSPRRRLSVPIINKGKPGSLKLDNEKIYDLIGFP